MRKIIILFLISFILSLEMNQKSDVDIDVINKSSKSLNYNILTDNGKNIIFSHNRIILNKNNLDDSNIFKKIELQLDENKLKTSKAKKTFKKIIKNIKKKHKVIPDYLFLEYDTNDGILYISSEYVFISENNFFFGSTLPALPVQKKMIKAMALEANEEGYSIESLLGESSNTDKICNRYNQGLYDVNISLEEFMNLYFGDNNIFITDSMLYSFQELITDIKRVQNTFDTDLDLVQKKLLSSDNIIYHRDTLKNRLYEDMVGFPSLDRSVFFKYFDLGKTPLVDPKAVVDYGRSVARINCVVDEMAWKTKSGSFSWVNDRNVIKADYDQLMSFYRKDSNMLIEVSKHGNSAYNHTFWLEYRFEPLVVTPRDNKYFLQGALTVYMDKNVVSFWEKQFDVNFSEENLIFNYIDGDYLSGNDRVAYQITYEQELLLDKAPPYYNLNEKRHKLFDIFYMDVSFPEEINKITKISLQEETKNFESSFDTYRFYLMSLHKIEIQHNAQITTIGGSPIWNPRSEYKIFHRNNDVYNELKILCDFYISDITKIINSNKYLSVTNGHDIRFKAFPDK
tara:strand:+ start:200 stop:1903 length:1704 start_codon:yes stop_codon:yes gene_type:complete